MKPGDAFYGPLNIENTTPHLWVIVTLANDEGKFAKVNVTTKDWDETCKIHPGEHERITEESFVYYRFHEWCSEEQMKKLVEQGIYKPVSAFSPALLKRVQEGASISPGASGKLKEATKRAIVS
jgi:hypothetical protein